MTEMVHQEFNRSTGEAIFQRWWRTIDRWTLSCVITLFSIGVLLNFAASPPLAEQNGFSNFHYVLRHIAFGMLSLGVMIFVSILDPISIRRLAVLGFIAAFIALLMLPFFGTDFGKGAVRWYSLGFASVQPSEFIKPTFVIVIAWFLAASLEPDGPPGTALSFALTACLVLILTLQPDFGQAALVLFGWGVIYFVSGAPILGLIAVAGLVMFFGSIAYRHSEHFAFRIDGFLNHEVDATTQLGYAFNAIRGGGIFGLGVGEGQVKWTLPDAHTDFIIAVAAEEYGFVLVLIIIALYAGIVIRSLLLLIRERDPFIRFAGSGLVCMFGAQAMINMAVAVRLLPAKGLTLPFISYGGSSLLAGGVALGMLLVCTRTRPQGEVEDILRRRMR
ncbi:MAG: putative peptidoglycan glycosyltransferase FtsW [Pelagibaca sp.]